jgi:integrase/recombinase XerC
MNILDSLTVGADGHRMNKPKTVGVKSKPQYVSYQRIYDFFEHLEAGGKSPSYIRACRLTLFSYCSFLFRSGITDIAKADRQAWHGFTKRLYDKGVSKATIAHEQSVIRCFYKYLVGEGLMLTNPFRGFSSPKLDKRLPNFLTEEEAKQLVEAPNVSTHRGLRDRTVLEVLYATGIRLSELVNLNLEQINLDEREIRVWGKGDKERIVLFGKPCAEALIFYLTQSRPNLLNGRKTRAVFVNRYGRRIGGAFVGRLLDRYSPVIGKSVHAHMLRHTFASHMLNGGADLRVVQELLGHAKLTTTQLYTHISKSQLRRVYLSAHPFARTTNGEGGD